MARFRCERRYGCEGLAVNHDSVAGGQTGKDLSSNDIVRKMRHRLTCVAVNGLQPYPSGISALDSGEGIAATSSGDSWPKVAK